MYTIILGANGDFHCSMQIQDGTECWPCETLGDAIKRMKEMAKAMNGVKIKTRDIVFFKETEKTVRTLEPWKPTK